MKKRRNEDYEINKIYNKYFSNFPIDVTYVWGNVNSEEYKQISEIIMPKELLLYDCPDGAIKFTDKTIILEHFQIDTSKFIKNGGTLLNIETNGIPQNFDRAVLLRNVKTKEELRKPGFLDKVNKYASYSNLADNFVNSYKNHFDKIKDYKYNILSSGEPDISKNFEIAFFIEDRTPYDAFIPNYSEIGISRADLIEKQRNNICYCLFQIKDIAVEYIFWFADVLNSKLVFYGNKKMILAIKEQ